MTNHARPTLGEVRFSAGSETVQDRDWSCPDRTPPGLADYAPRRTADAHAPLVFSVVDNPGGVGVDLRTVEVMLDGRPITRALKRHGAQFRYDLPEPLRRPSGLAPLEQWLKENYQSALWIRPAERPASIAVARKVLAVDTAFLISSPAVSVQEGAVYQVSYWTRHAMALGHAGAEGKHYASGVRWMDAKGNDLGHFTAFDYGPANPVWHQDHLTVTAPPGAHMAMMSFGWDWPDLPAGGEVAFADPRMEGPHPSESPGPNLHRVNVRASDLAGNVLQRDWWILVAGPPPVGRRHHARRRGGPGRRPAAVPDRDVRRVEARTQPRTISIAASPSWPRPASTRPTPTTRPERPSSTSSTRPPNATGSR